MYLFFDTETTGLPKKKNAPLDDLNNWPRVIQIGWLEYDKDGNEISKGDYIIKPNGFDIPEQSARIHKITTEIANEKGEDLRKSLEVFNSIISKSEYLVAHNIEFDEMVLGAEFKREYIKTDLFEKKRICTMKSSIDLVKIPSDKGGYRYPGLSDLHHKLFGEGFTGAHNAAVDIAITAKCFWEMKDKGYLNIFGDEAKSEQNIPQSDPNQDLSLF